MCSVAKQRAGVAMSVGSAWLVVVVDEECHLLQVTGYLHYKIKY